MMFASMSQPILPDFHLTSWKLHGARKLRRTSWPKNSWCIKIFLKVFDMTPNQMRNKLEKDWSRGNNGADFSGTLVKTKDHLTLQLDSSFIWIICAALGFVAVLSYRAMFQRLYNLFKYLLRLIFFSKSTFSPSYNFFIVFPQKGQKG